jgi:CoA-transferase family III
MDRWERSGLASLTGRSDGPPLAPPPGLTGFLDQLQRDIGDAAGVDVYDVLAMRVATHGLRRQGATSCGGVTRLVQSRDAWTALALAREADIDAVDAWLGTDGGATLDDTERWALIASAVATRSSDELSHPAVLLGLPFAVLGHHAHRQGVVIDTLGDRRPAPHSSPIEGARVVDLSALWAGPLCAHLLGRLGAHVVKVESTTRPDGARFGPPGFYDALHHGHDNVTLDFASPDGRAELRRLIAGADVVITASRPRALEALGVTPAIATNATAWVSITGYGSPAPWGDRVAFGDDAAAAGGLVVYDEDGPMFCGDAIADPLSGLVAAAAVVRQFASGTRGLLDVAMASVAADAVTR